MSTARTTRRTATKKPSSSSSSSSAAAAAATAAAVDNSQQHACSVDKTPERETQLKNNSDVLPQSSSAAAADDKSRDRMTSSDSERGDSGADNCPGTAPSADDAAQTTTTNEGQTNVQHATTSSSAGTTSPTADRKENSDEPETSSASSEPTPFASDQQIAITCGGNSAVMYLGARTSAKERTRDRRVLFEGTWLTPNEFQTVSGRGAAKDWKRTVKHVGQCIKALLAARLLSIDKDPVGCVCKHCTRNTDAADDARPTQSRDASDVTSGPDIVTSSSPETETVSTEKVAVRAKRKSGSIVRQSDTDTAAGGVVGCHGDRMTSSGVVKDEKGNELTSPSSSSSSSGVTSLKELELAAAAGRTTGGKLDDVKASKFDHLNRVIAELKRTKGKQSSVETSSSTVHSRIHVKDVSTSSTARLNNPARSHLNTERRSHQHSSTVSPTAAPLTTLPVLPFPGAFPGGLCGLSPAQLAPLQMYPPYIFMGFPLHPHLLQSYTVPSAEGPVTQPPSVNPAKRKSTQPMRSPSDEKLCRTADTLHSVGHIAYLPLVTSPPTHDASRDRKHLGMTSSGGRSSTDVQQGDGEFDQDGALDLTKK